MIWDKIFTTGIIDSDLSDKEVCARTFDAWACCMMGKNEPIPKKFGEGMVAVYKRLGISPQPESLDKYAKKRGWL